MSIGELQPVAKHRRTPMTAAEMLAHVAELLLDDPRMSSSELARKLSVPTPHAMALKDEVFRNVLQHIGTKYSPDVVARMKEEDIEGLNEVIQDCKDEVQQSREAGKLNTRAHGRTIAAQKVKNQMLGFNAPTLSVSADLSDFSLVKTDEQQALIHADPELQELVLAYNAKRRAIIAASRVDGPGGLRHDGEQRPMDAGPPPGTHQQGLDASGLGAEPEGDDLRAPSPREIGVRFEVLPGLVPGDLPSPEDPHGQP